MEHKQLAGGICTSLISGLKGRHTERESDCARPRPSNLGHGTSDDIAAENEEDAEDTAGTNPLGFDFLCTFGRVKIAGDQGREEGSHMGFMSCWAA